MPACSWSTHTSCGQADVRTHFNSCLHALTLSTQHPTHSTLFPSPLTCLCCCCCCYSQDYVEDTKGNNGVVGELTLTNLRIMWVSKKVHRTNISLGLGNITSLSMLPANSRLKGRWLCRAKGLPLGSGVLQHWWHQQQQLRCGPV